MVAQAHVGNRLNAMVGAAGLSLGDYGTVRDRGGKLVADASGSQAATIRDVKLAGRKQAFAMLQEALEADPKVKEATAKLTTAQGELIRYRGDLEAQVTGAPNARATLEANITSAKQEVATARKAFVAAGGAEVKEFRNAHAAVQNSRANIRTGQAEEIRKALKPRAVKAKLANVSQTLGLTHLAAQLDSEATHFAAPEKASTASVTAGVKAAGSWLGKHPVRNASIGLGLVVGGYAAYKLLNGNKEMPQAPEFPQSGFAEAEMARRQAEQAQATQGAVRA